MTESLQEFKRLIASPSERKRMDWWATRAVLPLVFDAYRFMREREGRILNISVSRDQYGIREEFYRILFGTAHHELIDFWDDKFIYNGETLPDSHTLPFPDNSFDALITTQVIFEHVSDPLATMKELARVLRAGGGGFIIGPFITPVHQPPHDFFRYTEFGLKYLFEKAGLEVVYIKPANSGFMTTVDALSIFNIFEILPRGKYFIKRILRKVLLPAGAFLDRFIPDRGRFPKYYLCRVSKRV